MHALFDLVEPLFELVDLGPVVIDHGVDDAMHQRDRALGEDVVVARAQSSLIARCCGAGRRGR